MPNVKLSKVTFTYSNIKNPVLLDFSWNKPDPGVVAVLGSNGSGKSTLLRLLAGFLSPVQGSIQVSGQEVKGTSSVKQRVTFVPENAKLFLLGPTPRKDLLRIIQDEKRVLKLYKNFNLQHLIDKKLYHMSEGQRRLIALLHAFQLSNEVILLDEPSIGLDSKSRSIFFHLLSQAKEQEKIILIATNDTRLFSKADEILVLENARPKLFGPTKRVLYELLEKTELLPNQLVYLIHQLEQNHHIKLPKFIHSREFNEYLQGDPS